MTLSGQKKSHVLPLVLVRFLSYLTSSGGRLLDKKEGVWQDQSGRGGGCLACFQYPPRHAWLYVLEIWQGPLTGALYADQ